MVPKAKRWIMAPLQTIINHVHLAINAMESLYNCGNLEHNSPAPFTPCSKVYTNKLGAALLVVGRYRNKKVLHAQIQVISNLAICRQMPTVWFLRSHSPEKTIFTMMCILADVPVKRITSGEMTDKDFANLTCVAGNLSAAPIRICETSSSDQFKESVEALLAEKSFSYVVCDWELDGADLALAKQLGGKSVLTFLHPHQQDKSAP